MEKQLEKAIQEQLGCETEEDFKQTLQDVCRGGGNSGFSGFTYSAELLEFYKANKMLIREDLTETASDIGVSLIEMIHGFNCFKDQDLSIEDIAEILYGNNYDHEMASIVVDALCWAVLENIAFQYDGRA